MKHEYEAKFIGFTLEKARELLKNHGYTCICPEKTMVRKSFHVEGNNTKWGRVRDEGDKITLTIKEEVLKGHIMGMKEAEVVINDFKAGEAVLEMCGFHAVGIQETRREIWQKGEVEVMVDTWPGLSPFLEVEGENAQVVEKACTELNLNMKEALFGGVGIVYMKEAGFSEEMVNNLKEITFANPPKSAV